MLYFRGDVFRTIVSNKNRLNNFTHSLNNMYTQGTIQVSGTEQWTLCTVYTQGTIQVSGTEQWTLCTV